jgi:hypothetical protein
MRAAHPQPSVLPGRSDGTCRPIFAPMYSYKPMAIRKQVFDALRNEQYPQLKIELKQWGADKVSEFFIREGAAILDWAIFTKKAAPLFFLYEVMPSEMLKNLLSKDDWELLRGFLMSESGMEKLKIPSAESRYERIKKFTALLTIGEDKLKNFIEANENEDYMTDLIRNDFRIAIDQYTKLKNLESLRLP